MEKKELRILSLKKRNSLNPAERQKKDRLIMKRLESLDVFQENQRILIYYSVNGEAGTLSIMRKWMEKKSFYLPRLTSASRFLAMPVASLDDLEVNSYGIPEPKWPENGPDLGLKLDLIVVPGVAFDRNGNRLGMGKGYYDRFLSGQKGITRIALAYSEQILDRVPSKPYDEPVDMIITEKEIIRCK